MTLEKLYEILLSDKPSILIKENEDKIFKFIPELSICKNFDQNNEWHIYDVYEHILHVVDGVPNNLVLRLTALFHDIGKPETYVEDEQGIGHFYNHWNVSKDIFLSFALENNVDIDLTNLVSKLIFYHDVNIDKMTDEELELMIKDIGKENIELLFYIKKSDLLAQNSKYHYLLDNYNKQENKLLIFKQ